MPAQHATGVQAYHTTLLGPFVRFPQVDLGAFEEELSRAINSATPQLQQVLAGLRVASPPPHSHPPRRPHIASSFAEQLLWMGEGGAGGAAVASAGVPGVRERRLRAAVAGGTIEGGEEEEEEEEDGHVADAPHAPMSW